VVVVVIRTSGSFTRMKSQVPAWSRPMSIGGAGCCGGAWACRGCRWCRDGPGSGRRCVGRRRGLLYREVWRYAVVNDAAPQVALVDPWPHELLRDFYGFPFEQLGESHGYMGGDVRPRSGLIDRSCGSGFHSGSPTRSGDPSRTPHRDVDRPRSTLRWARATSSQEQLAPRGRLR
jgi:hypothetical protein